MRNKHRWYAFDKLIREKTKNDFKPLDRRTKTIKSYWDFYKEAGIFKAIGKEVRKKYNIPKLTSIEDHIFYDRSIGDDNVELDDYAWLSKSGLEKQINNEVDHYLKHLILPINATESLKYWILYDEDLGMYPLYGIIDLIYDITLGTHFADEYTGYTTKEIDYLIQEAAKLVKNMDWLETKDQKDEFLHRFIKQIKTYQRKIRPLRSPKTKARMVRLYKKKTSQDIAQINAGNTDISLKTANKKAAAIRKQVERLHKEFPFLRDLLQNHK